MWAAQRFSTSEPVGVTDSVTTVDLSTRSQPHRADLLSVPGHVCRPDSKHNRPQNLCPLRCERVALQFPLVVCTLEMLSNGPVSHRTVQATHRVTDLSKRHPVVGGKTGDRHGMIDAHDQHRPVTPDSCQQVDGRRDRFPEQSGERSPARVVILDPGGCLSGELTGVGGGT